MTKRGIEESLASSTFAGTASPQTNMNGVSSLQANGGQVVEAMALDASAASAFAHLNGVIDPSVVAMMPDIKKMKVELSGDSSPNSSASSTGAVGTLPIKSRVIHVRNIPPDTTVNDLYGLAAPFGTMTKHLLVKSKGQAFIEFDSHLAAVQMANYWIQTTIGGHPSSMQPGIRGRHVHCQMSNHKELKSNFDNTNNNDGDGYDRNGSSDRRNGTNGDTSATPSPVIRVVIENMCYPVTLDQLHGVFSRAGKVHKIVTFTKGSVFQALVQYADIAGSIQAKLTLDSQCLFSQANVLRIDYSKLQNLTVKYNNEKSRDYTQPGLGAGNFSANGGTSSANGGGNGESSVASDFGSLLPPGHNASSLQALAQFGSSFGAVGTLGTTNGQYARAYSTGASPATIQALSNAAALSGLVTPANAAMFASAAAGAGLTGLVLSPVIHVSGLSTEHTTPDALFTLFGVYGDVVRVKILFNKKDTALIQMAEPSQAHLAISHLDRTKLHGKTLRVNSSKHQVVQMPKEGHQDSGLTKDYTNSPLHRFKRPGSKNFNNIYPPSETLHVSNIPSTVSEDELKQAFYSETGKDVTKFKFFPNDRRMALVQFGCVEDSILALIKMHNYKVAEHSHLRVSFSKSPV